MEIAFVKGQFKIKGKTGELIAEHSESALLSKKLVTLVRDIPLDMDFEKLKPQNPDNEKLISILRRLEFYSLIKQLVTEDTTDNTNDDYKVISNDSELESLVDHLTDKKEFSFLIANDKLGRPVGLSVTAKKAQCFYIPVGHLTLTSSGQLPLETVFRFLKPIFENEKTVKITHNIKSQFPVFEKYGIRISNIFDTEIASYLLNPSGKNHQIIDMVIEYLGMKIEGGNGGDFENMEIEETKNILCKQTDVILRCHKILDEKLEKEKLLSLFNDIEMPLANVL